MTSQLGWNLHLRRLRRGSGGCIPCRIFARRTENGCTLSAPPVGVPFLLGHFEVVWAARIRALDAEIHAEQLSLSNPLYPRGLQAGGQMELLAAGLSPGFEMSLSGIELLAAGFAEGRAKVGC